MTMVTRFLTVAALGGGIAAPLGAQVPYPYPQPYPQTYPPGYAYPGQGYGSGGIQSVIDQLLGNRYNVTDRQAVSQCASAAMVQAQAQFGGGYGGNSGYGYNNRGYAGASNLRVTSITDVQRRQNGLRVKGLMSSGYGGQNGYQNGYQNRGYGAEQLSFRCNVDYRGAVTNIRIGRSSAYRGY